MEAKYTHDWNISPDKAKEAQKELAKKVIKETSFKSVNDDIKTIAACAYKYDENKDSVTAAVIIYSFPDLLELEQKHTEVNANFPYTRELADFTCGPAFIKLFSELENKPDLLIFSGHGLDHPRQCGIATHLGILYDMPSIACSVELLYGGFRRQPKNSKGSYEALWDNNGFLIGRIFRSKDNSDPIYISIGHKVSLDTAGSIISLCLREDRRIPRPVRRAFQYVEQSQHKSIF